MAIQKNWFNIFTVQNYENVHKVKNNRQTVLDIFKRFLPLFLNYCYTIGGKQCSDGCEAVWSDPLL